jgi:DegV family protein with EDD domain
MQKFVIVTDSGSDLPLDFVTKNDVVVIPLIVHFKHEAFKNFPDQREIKTKDFYARLREKQVAKTSQINSEDFIQYVEPLLQAGKDVLTITISSTLSGSYNSMIIGRDMLLEKYPDRKIVIVDSLSASLGEGFLVHLATLERAKGRTIEETSKFLEEIKLKVCAIFTVDELGTLMRGGRISVTKAFLGTLLNMKPLLKINDEGKLVPFGKARGRKKSIMDLLDEIDKQIDDFADVFIAHGDIQEEALKVKEEIIKRQPKIKSILVNDIGPVIGAHAGPGTLAFVYIGKSR